MVSTLDLKLGEHRFDPYPESLNWLDIISLAQTLYSNDCQVISLTLSPTIDLSWKVIRYLYEMVWVHQYFEMKIDCSFNLDPPSVKCESRDTTCVRFGFEIDSRTSHLAGVGHLWLFVT